MVSAEQLAADFHSSYERLAPRFGYRTREASAVPWENVPPQNRDLMVAVAAEILHIHIGPLHRLIESAISVLSQARSHDA